MSALAWDGADMEPLGTMLVRLGPADQDRYIDVPFHLGPDATSLAAEITVTGPDETVIDLGLADPEGTRGWSGGSHRSLFVAEDHASPGYRSGPLPEGRWAVVLGTYRVPEPGCSVEVVVRHARTGLRWLRGDLHIHTTHSDGRADPSELARLLVATGIDFAALSDHNTTSTLRAFPTDRAVIGLPAMEWTTQRGHANLIGSERPLRDVRATGPEEIAARLAEARRSGAFVSVNHPFEDSCKGCTWDWGFEDTAIDALEVWNGLWRPSCERALSYWQDSLVDGRRLIASGGTDYHAAEPFAQVGSPTTWVLAMAKTRLAILQALKAGRVSIAVSPDGPLLDLRCGSYLQGDQVPPADAAEVTLSATGLAPGDRVRLWSDQGPEREVEAVDAALTLALDSRGRRFWRAEAWRHCRITDSLRPAALSNPVFLRSAGA